MMNEESWLTKVNEDIWDLHVSIPSNKIHKSSRIFFRSQIQLNKNELTSHSLIANKEIHSAGHVLCMMINDLYIHYTQM